MPPLAVHTEDLWDVNSIEANGAKSAKPLHSNEGSKRFDRSVSFLETVNYREIAPLTELSEEEIRSVWYDDDERP